MLLLLTSPLWGGPFLLVQAMRLCADGLIQMVEDARGRPLRLARPLRWLLGVVGLPLFPLLVGLRGLGGVLVSLGRRALPLSGLRRRSWLARGAALLVGLVAGILVPLWLPVAILVWLIRYVLWALLVPEFRRTLRRRGQRGDERMVTFVGLRYLFASRETALHSATSYYAAAGIALGVCALIVVLAVMSGFDQEVKSRIVGTNAHVILLRVGATGILHADSLAARVATDPDVEAVAPFVYSKAMLSAGNAAEGAIVKGIDWERAVRVTEVARYAGNEGRDPGLGADAEGRPGIVLGKHIATNLGVVPGDEVILISPAESHRTPLGFVPRMRRFVIRGLFDSGMYEFDASMALVDLPEAQSFFGLGDRVTGLEVRIRDMDRAPEVGDALAQLLGGFPYHANNWIELNANLFSWMRTEKRAMFVILIMIILVAGFNIASSLVMLVTEKRREIGILKSMGATPIGILRIFVLEGWVMALAGTALGTAAGLGICHVLERYKIIRLPKDIYFIDTLPVRVEGGDIGWIVGSVLVIAALSTLYPAWRAARLDPVEAIRSE